MDGNYIKISRRLLEWEWYSNINVKVLFFHMLLKANWKNGRFQGIEIPRGSFVSSINKLSDETGLSVRNIRTALDHLKTTGEVTSKSHSKYTVFTINHYELYQTSDKQSDKEVTSNRQTTDKQPTTIEEGKKEKKEEKNKKRVSADPLSGPAFSEDSFEMQCVNAVVQSCLRQFQGAKVPKTEKEKAGWCVHVGRMKRLDGHSEKEIREALDYAINDPFWKTNIRSTKKLREKFDTLIVQARQRKGLAVAKKTGFQNFKERETDYDAMVQDMVNDLIGGMDSGEI